MNKWHLTAIVKKDAIVKTGSEGEELLFFKVCNTEEIEVKGGEIRERETWVECLWVSPPADQKNRIKAKWQVYLEGPLSVRPYVDKHGKSGYTLHLDVCYGKAQPPFEEKKEAFRQSGR